MDTSAGTYGGCATWGTLVQKSAFVYALFAQQPYAMYVLLML